MTDIKLNDYIDLIRKEAWHYAKKYCLDFDEVLSACYEVYCKALRTNDPTRASFSTYLVLQLRSVPYHFFYKTLKHRKKFKYVDLMHFPQPERKEFNIEEFKGRLPEFARQVVEWILSREWEIFGKCGNSLPTVNSARKHFKISIEKMNRTWARIETEFKNANID